MKETEWAQGEYMIDVTLLGGTGRADITSPAEIRITQEGVTALIEWSSPSYDYMIVDDIVHVKNIDESLNKYPDIKSHLHYQNKGFEKGENIIICGSRFGTFNYEDKYRLTKLGYSKTIWELPDFFKGANISYCNTVTDPSRFKSAEIGQEFVVTNFDEVKMKNWLNTLGIGL